MPFSEAENHVYAFGSQAVRDLAWAINSVPIADKFRNHNSVFFKAGFCEEEYREFLPTLIKIDANPQPLLSFLQATGSRLIGKRFEHLIEFWLRNSSRFDVIASGLQVKRKNRTLGEFDFILKDNFSCEYIHLEVTGKFFLWNGKSDDFSNFVGPNPKDNLQKKLDSIFSKQIKLSETTEGKNLLKIFGIEKITPKVCFKGYIFYPFNRKNIPQLFPQSHPKGYWLELEETDNLTGEHWTILERANWISPAFKIQDVYTIDEIKKEINKYFETNDYPLLIAKLAKENEIYYEKNRFFIVKNRNYLTDEKDDSS